MAKVCSIINTTTKEPKIFYKTDTGATVNTLQEAISQSIQSYEFGIFKNEAEFKPLGKSPIYNKNSKEGLIQEFIGDGLLEAKVVKGKQMFSVKGDTPLIQGIIAESIEEVLRIKIGGAHFTRKGENFDISLGKEFDNMIANSIQYSFEEAMELFPVEKAVDMNLFDAFSSKKREFKDAKYSEETLVEAIEDLLGDLGISITNIEDYKKTYKSKYGVDPSAEALADITNRIIAVAEGKETVDTLTEETSHFIVEGWKSAEIDKLLPFIPQTSQYTQYAPQYREVYRKEGLSGDALENKVRKEILGKILAESLQANTDITSKTDIEQNIFRRVLEFFENWITNLIDKITPATSESIKEFTEEVKNLLYNKQLAAALDLSGAEQAVYYSLNMNPQSPNMSNESGKILDDLFSYFKINKTSSSNVTNFLAILNVIERNIDKIEAAPEYAYHEEIRTLTQEILPLAKNSFIETIFELNKSKKELRSSRMEKESSISRATGDKKSKLEKELKDIDLALQRNKELEKKATDLFYKTTNKLTNIETVSKSENAGKFRELLETMAESFEKKNSDPKKRQEFREHVRAKLSSVQKDSSWFGKMFMPLYLSSNIFQQMMGSVMMKMWVNINLTMEREIAPRVYKLVNNVKAVQGLMGDNFIRSFYKNDMLQADIDTLKKKILQDNFPNVTYLETDTMGDIESSLKEDLPLFKTIFNIAINNNEIEGLSLKNAGQLEIYEKLGFIKKDGSKLLLNNDTLDHFKIYLNHRQAISYENSRIKKEFDITDDIFHKQHSVLKRWINSQKSIFSQDFNFKQLDSANFSDFVPTMNQFLKPGLILSPVKIENSIEINLKNNTEEGENLYLKLTDPNNVEAVIAFYEQAASFENFKKSETGDTTNRETNFRKAWNKFVKSFPEGTSDDFINAEAVNWLKYHTSFSTDTIFSGSGSKFNKENIIEAIGEDKWTDEVETLVGKIDALYRQKTAILSVVRESTDFKEIAGSEISDEQKQNLRDIEDAISAYIKELSGKTGDDTEIFQSLSEDAVFATANTSFMSFFIEETAGDTLETIYQEASLENLESVFKRESSVNNINRYTTAKKIFRSIAAKGASSTITKQYKKDKDFYDNLAVNLNYAGALEMFQDFNTNEDSKLAVYRALIGLNLPAEFKRYDKPEHLEFIRDVENGLISVQDLVEKNIPLPEGLLLDPSFIHDSEFDDSKTKKELIVEYAENAETLTTKEKFDILKELEGNVQYEIGEKYQDKDFEKKIKDGNLADSYTALLDMMIKSLHNYQKYNHNVFSLPNFRKTGRDTFVSLASSKNKSDLKNKAKIFLEETVAYREDELADTTTGSFSFVPKTGLMSLTKEERSTDMIHLYTTMMAQSILYKNRSETLKDAFAIIDEAETKQYKGVRASDSKTIAKLKETVDLELYGKKELRKLEKTVFGKTIDLSKLIHSARKFITMNTLGLSPIIAATAYSTSRSSYEILKRAGLNREIYASADSRASTEWKKLLSGTLKSAGTIDGATKLEEILRMFGGYDILARTSNTKFGRAVKNLEMEKIAFGALKMAEYPILSKMVLSKLMEYRMIEGKFMTFEDFKNNSFIQGITKTDQELKKEFDTHSKKSLYDYTITDIDGDSLFKEAMALDPSLKSVYESSKNLSANDKVSVYSKASELFKESIKNRINLIQLTKDGYNSEDNLDEDLVNISLQIADIKARLTQQLPKGGTVLAQNDTVLSFVMTFRQWLVQSIHSVNANEGKENGLYIPFNNFNTGVTQLGQYPSLYNLFARSFGVGGTRTADNKKAFLAFKTAWEAADPSERVALRGLALSSMLWVALGALSAAAIGYADDDEDNALKQFNAYLLQRTMKEGFGSTNPVGLFNEFLGILNNPITVGRSVKSMAGLLAVWNINDEVKSGQYEGWSKYMTDAFKLTLLKNVYQQSDAEGLKEARLGYRHFGEEEWFSPFEAVKVFEEEKETE